MRNYWKMVSTTYYYVAMFCVDISLSFLVWLPRIWQNLCRFRKTPVSLYYYTPSPVITSPQIYTDIVDFVRASPNLGINAPLNVYKFCLFLR